MPDIQLTIVLRGYETAAVNDLIRQANQALASADAAVRSEVERKLRQPGLRRQLRGYDCGQVDTLLATLADQLAAR